MEGWQGQKSLKEKCEIYLFVHVNVTTHTAANEVALFENLFAYVTWWYAGMNIPIYSYTPCLFMKDVEMVHWYAHVQTSGVIFVHEDIASAHCV